MLELYKSYQEKVRVSAMYVRLGLRRTGDEP